MIRDNQTAMVKPGIDLVRLILAFDNVERLLEPAGLIIGIMH